MARTDPIRPTDDEARALARTLLDKAPFAALGVLVEGAPLVTRIALFCPADGAPVTLRANDRVIGRGELVLIGDELGVRLTSLQRDGSR